MATLGEGGWWLEVLMFIVCVSCEIGHEKARSGAAGRAVISVVVGFRRKQLEAGWWRAKAA
jgi:hypothetical protein